MITLYLAYLYIVFFLLIFAIISFSLSLFSVIITTCEADAGTAGILMVFSDIPPVIIFEHFFGLLRYSSRDYFPTLHLIFWSPQIFLP